MTDVGSHAVADGLDKVVDFFSWSLGDQFDPTIREIADKTSHIEVNRDIPGGISKTDSLYSAIKIAVATTEFSSDLSHEGVYSEWTGCVQDNFFFMLGNELGRQTSQLKSRAAARLNSQKSHHFSPKC